MSNFYLGSDWQSDIAKLISVSTGTAVMSDSKIQLVNKKYEEAKNYGNTGTTIDAYVSKNAKVSLPVAKEFRIQIAAIKTAELEKQEAMRQLELKKLKAKGKAILKWYHYALIGGGMLTLIALSPTLTTLSRALPSKR